MNNLEFGSENVEKKGHPGVVVAHLGFRVSALFIYMFGGIFSMSFVTSFVFILLCLAIDFWTVKNVTGRFLVGLRWRNNIEPTTGQSSWVYESRSEEGFKRKPVMPNEFRAFWGALILCPLMWALLGLSALFTLKFPSFIVCLSGFGFNGANLYGYIRCKIGGFDAVKNYANNLIGKQMLSRFMSSAPAAPAQSA